MKNKQVGEDAVGSCREVTGAKGERRTQASQTSVTKKPIGPAD